MGDFEKTKNMKAESTSLKINGLSKQLYTSKNKLLFTDMPAGGCSPLGAGGCAGKSV
jgi:hypothetical protein